MKNLSMFITIAVIILQGYKATAAFHRDSVPAPSYQFSNYNQYFKKSQAQKKLSTGMFIGGSIMLSTGIALALSQLSGLFDPHAPHHNYGAAPDILSVVGGSVIVAAIPLTFESKKNKKKASKQVASSW